MLPLQVGGFSFFATELPMLLIIVAYLLEVSQRPASLIAPLVMAVILLVVVWMRVSFDMSTGGFLHTGVGIRFLVIWPICFILARSAVRYLWFMKCAVRILVFNGVVAAVVGIAYVAGWSNYSVLPIHSTHEYIDKTRATGLLGGSNVFGNFLVIPLLVTALCKKIPLFVRLSAIAVIVGGIISSQSRNASIAAILVLVLLAFQERQLLGLSLLVRMGRLAFLLLTCVMIFAAIVLQMKTRFESGSVQDRFQKATLGITATCRSFSTILIGADDHDSDASLPEELQFSDNSFVLTLSAAGIPAMLVFFGIIAKLRTSDTKVPLEERWVVRLIILAVLFVNNALLWDIWLLHIAVGYEMISQRKIESAWHGFDALTPRSVHI